MNIYTTGNIPIT